MPYKQAILIVVWMQLVQSGWTMSLVFQSASTFSPILESAVFWHTQNLSEILVLGAKSVSPVFTGFQGVFTGFQRVSPVFTGFQRFSNRAFFSFSPKYFGATMSGVGDYLR